MEKYTPTANARVLQIIPLRIHTEELFSQKGISYLNIPLFVSAVLKTQKRDNIWLFFKRKSLNILSLHTKALLFSKVCSWDPGLLLPNQWHDLFQKMAKFPTLTNYISAKTNFKLII